MATDPAALIAQARKRGEAFEFTSTASDGTEIVFCGEQPNGVYVGWTPRETAEAHGYEIRGSDRDDLLLSIADALESLVRVAEAARLEGVREVLAEVALTVTLGTGLYARLGNAQVALDELAAALDLLGGTDG